MISMLFAKNRTFFFAVQYVPLDLCFVCHTHMCVLPLAALSHLRHHLSSYKGKTFHSLRATMSHIIVSSHSASAAFASLSLFPLLSAHWVIRTSGPTSKVCFFYTEYVLKMLWFDTNLSLKLFSEYACRLCFASLSLSVRPLVLLQFSWITRNSSYLLNQFITESTLHS